MATVKITKRAVDALTAGTRATYLWDAELKGFEVRWLPGGAKTYIVQFSVGHGGRGARKPRVTIGKHGSPSTVEMARQKVRRLLGLLAQGEDPAEEIQAGRRTVTLGELIDVHRAEGCAHNKPSTLIADRGRFAQDIRPALGSKKVTDLTRTDIAISTESEQKH